MDKTRLFRPADALLILLILLAVLLGLRPRLSGTGVSASIIQNGEVCAIVDLTDPTRREYVFDGNFPLTIVAENGTVYFATADCPDQVCVRSGRLSHPGDTAACLPAGIVIRVDGSAFGVDGVTG